VVTRVNGAPVKDVVEFEALVKDATAFKLDVLRMANTRVVQFKLDAPAEAGAGEEAPDVDDDAGETESEPADEAA
jgi:hypothetical protein